MRLTERQVNLIVRKIVDTLKQKQLVSFKHKEGAVIEAMTRVFLENLQMESQIEEEARQLMTQYRQKASADIDEQKMFRMIKKELAKKYRVII